MNRVRGSIRLAALLAVAACSKYPSTASGPLAALDTLHWFASAPPSLRSAGIDRPELRIDLEAARTSLDVGDSIELVAVARNSSAASVQVGRSCGPAMDVCITAPTGQTASAIWLRIADPSHAALTCELGPYHFAAANDSLINRYWWKAPAFRGEYVAVAGARFNEGLADESSMRTITVR